MTNLTNIIEAIVFASGDAVPVKYIVEKLGCSLREANLSIGELKEKYDEECGIQLLTFNGKLQFASNPKYKQQISEVLIPVKEKEFTRTILECAAIIAYKQPITKPELEEIRQVSCDYAISMLLKLEMIAPTGRKDAVGKPILYSTTDNFLKRFKLNSIDELPDYDELMAQIAQLNGPIDDDDENANYLYKKDVYVDPDGDDGDGGDGDGSPVLKPSADRDSKQNEQNTTDDGFELPDFITDEDDLIKID